MFLTYWKAFVIVLIGVTWNMETTAGIYLIIFVGINYLQPITFYKELNQWNKGLELNKTLSILCNSNEAYNMK